MAAGGWVPGDPNDNTDSVSARLSPGEYVIPKGQARETVHAPISTSSYSPPPAPSDQQSGQQSTQSPAASTHTDVGAGSATIANLGKLYTGRGAGAVYDAQGNLVTSNPGLTAQAAAGAGSTMMPGGGIRDPSGNVFDSNATLAAQDVGGAGATMPGGGVGGMGQMGSAIGGAIGSIGSALQSALANVPSWKMQPSHIPDPSSFKKQQTQYNLQTPSA